MHEFIAFVSLRAGERLQWYNIFRELSSPNLNFKADEVAMLLVQVAWQAGSSFPGKKFRKSHTVFADSAFRMTMYEMLLMTVEKIQAS